MGQVNVPIRMGTFSSIAFRARGIWRLRLLNTGAPPPREATEDPAKPCRCAIGPFQVHNGISRHRTQFSAKTPQKAEPPPSGAVAAKSPSLMRIRSLPISPAHSFRRHARGSSASSRTWRLPSRPAENRLRALACACFSSCRNSQNPFLPANPRISGRQSFVRKDPSA